MNKPIVLGFCGRKGAGKDTAVEALLDVLRVNGIQHAIHVFAFASNLKETLITALGLTKDHFEDRELKETPLPKFNNETPRDLCKWLGEAFKMKFGPDYAVERMKDKIEQVMETCPRPIILVSDVRFPNEADLIVRQYGGTIVYMNASDRLGPNTDLHPTEQHFPEIMQRFEDNLIVLNNNLTVTDLKMEISTDVFPWFFT